MWKVWHSTWHVEASGHTLVVVVGSWHALLSLSSSPPCLSSWHPGHRPPPTAWHPPSHQAIGLPLSTRVQPVLGLPCCKQTLATPYWPLGPVASVCPHLVPSWSWEQSGNRPVGEGLALWALWLLGHHFLSHWHMGAGNLAHLTVNLHPLEFGTLSFCAK